MIFTDRTITVKNGNSSINEPIILYRGDKEVEIRFVLKEKAPFIFNKEVDSNIIELSEAAYGQLIIKRPNDLPAVFSEIVPTNEGKIIFTITAEMIDEITEVGNYTFQIRLLDESRNSRATLPEVVNGIEIREPIATEDISNTNEVGVATVGYALTTAGTTEDAFDSQGNYNKTTWAPGDRITDAKLNKIEAGIDGVNQKVATGGTGGSNDAKDISITDTGNYFTSTNVEGALQEVSSQINEIVNVADLAQEGNNVYIKDSNGNKVGNGITISSSTGTGTANTKVEYYDTQPLGILFDRPDGWNYVTWCSNALNYDKNINKYINLIWARGGHTTENNGDSQDTIYRAIINADTFEIEELVPIVMLDSDGETDITTSLMEGASFIILKDGTYVYGSYLDNTETYIGDRYTSTDYGKTWVKTPNSRGGGTGYKQLELSNGRILVSSTAKGSGISYSDDKLITLARATIDGGYGLAFGTYVAEWAFIELEPGYVMAIGRKNQGGAGSEFNGDSDHALITYSTDYGSTWSQIQESTTIDNMNASNATGIVHDGIVEIFTTSRWYHGTKYTNNDYTKTGKDGAMFHYVATIEDAKNDNFTNLGAVLYANGSNNSAQDFHAPCLAHNTKTNDILIVYMDRMAAIPDRENNNYHFVRGGLGKVNLKILNTFDSAACTFSGKEISNRLKKQKSDIEKIINSTKNSLLEDILAIKYTLSQIEGSGVTQPEVPGDVVLWTTQYNASENTTLFNDGNSPFKNIISGTSFVMTTDSFGNTVQKIGGNGAPIALEFSPTKNNYAIEVIATDEHSFGEGIPNNIYLINSSLKGCRLYVDNQYCGKQIGSSYTVWDTMGNVANKKYPSIETIRVVCRNDVYEVYYKQEDGSGNVLFEASQNLTADDLSAGEQSAIKVNYASKGVYMKGRDASIQTIKIGEWD